MNLRAKIRETLINTYKNNYLDVDIYNNDLSSNGIASKLADAVVKRVERHIEEQRRKKRPLVRCKITNKLT